MRYLFPLNPYNQQSKKCSKCKKELNLEYFTKDKRLKSGLKSVCKKCHYLFMSIYQKTEKYKRARAIRRKKYYEKNLNSWTKIIPTKTNCEVCGFEIYFNNKQMKSIGNKHTIHFDHKTKNLPIKNPTPWLMAHKFSNLNKSIWESCDFGVLCASCNRRIPTENRKEWLLKVLDYINK